MLQESTLSLKSSLGLDFEAKLACSQVYRVIQELMTKTEEWMQRQLELKYSDAEVLEKAFPLFPEEESILEQLTLLNGMKSVMMRTIEADGLQLTMF
jgi:hypothetical protein